MPMAMGPPLAVAVFYEIGADLLQRELKGQALALGGAQALAGLVDPAQCGAELAGRRVERQGGLRAVRQPCFLGVASAP